MTKSEWELFTASEKERENIYMIRSFRGLVISEMSVKEFVQKHPSIIGIVIGLCILVYIVFVIATTQRP